MLTEGSSHHKRETAPTLPLSDEHRQMLEESGISSEGMAARGYWTASSLAHVPDVFPKWQRRRGLVVPSLSPDGATLVYQLRPERPITRKDGKAPKYETPTNDPVTLDVNPLMLKEVRSGSRDLWITEGAKKVDALASVGEPAVGGRGVHMFAVPGTKGTVPLPCWQHVRLKGRTATIVFDADARTNADVQEALRRQVVMLEAIGARVLVVYLSAVNGDSKAGVDDYLAAGGTVAQLKLMAQPFAPVDVARERLNRDKRLQTAVAERWRILRDMSLKTTRQNTAAAMLRPLTLEAERSGDLVEREGRQGIRVKLDRRTLSERSGRSQRSIHGAIEYLEDEGSIMRDNTGRRADRAGAFVLFVGSELGNQYGEMGEPGEKVSEGEESLSSRSNGRYDPGDYPTRSPGEEVGPLRWPKVILYRARKDGREVVAATHYVWRLGEKRGQILRHVLEAGGRAPLADLLERFAGERTRARDFRRWTLAPLMGWRYRRDRVTREVTKVRVGPALVEMEYTPEDAYVRALPECLDDLEVYRERGDEIADAERQREEHARQRRKYRENHPRRHEHPADKEPGLYGRERAAEILEERRKDEECRWIEQQRQKVGMTAAVFVADELETLTGVRWRELRQRWIEKGGNAEDLRQAVTFGPFRFEREPSDEHLYVYPGSTAEDRSNLASVASLERAEPQPDRTPARAKPYKRADGVYVHPGDCACEWCGEDLEPSYARTRGVS
jgi:hypothetical protein